MPPWVGVYPGMYTSLPPWVGVYPGVYSQVASLGGGIPWCICTVYLPGWSVPCVYASLPYHGGYPARYMPPYPTSPGTLPGPHPCCRTPPGYTV